MKPWQFMTAGAVLCFALAGQFFHAGHHFAAILPAALGLCCALAGWALRGVP